MTAGTALDRALLAFAVPRRKIGLGIVRTGLAAVIAGLYVQNIPWHALLWGPNGMIPMKLYGQTMLASHGANLYYLSAQTWWFELVFWTGLTVTLAYAVGVLPVLTGPLCFAFTWSLLTRNNFVQDAGWNLTRILLIYLFFADTSAFALASGRIEALAKRVPVLLKQMRGVLHNSALGLILFQLCLLYATSVFYKVTGHKWQDGTALYYVLRSNQFDLSALGGLIWSSAFLVAAGTYGTLLFQAAYPFWIWQKPFRYVVAAGAVFFHLSILWTMALPFFSAIMIVSEAVLFTDDEYRRAWAWLRSRLPVQAALPADEPVAATVASGG